MTSGNSVKWPEHGITLKEVELGLKVEQAGQFYIAKGWRLTSEVIAVCELAFDAGLTCVLRKGHPSDPKLNDENVTVDHLGFSLCPEHYWVFVLDRNSVDDKSDQDRKHPKTVTVRKKARFILRNRGVEFEPEWGSSQNVLVKTIHLQKCLAALKPSFRDLGFVGKKRAQSKPTPDFFWSEDDMHSSMVKKWEDYPLSKALNLKLLESHYNLKGKTVVRGQLDILAQAENGDLVVIELKDHAITRGNESPVAQLRRYMQSPKIIEMAAEKGSQIKGLLVAQSYSRKTKEELSVLSSPDIAAYELRKKDHATSIKCLDCKHEDWTVGCPSCGGNGH